MSPSSFLVLKIHEERTTCQTAKNQFPLGALPSDTFPFSWVWNLPRNRRCAKSYNQTEKASTYHLLRSASSQSCGWRTSMIPSFWLVSLIEPDDVDTTITIWSPVFRDLHHDLAPLRRTEASEESIDTLRAALPECPFERSLMPGNSFFDLCAQAFPRGRVSSNVLNYFFS